MLNVITIMEVLDQSRGADTPVRKAHTRTAGCAVCWRARGAPGTLVRAAGNAATMEDSQEDSHASVFTHVIWRLVST